MFMAKHPSVLITGSNIEKTVEQVGQAVLDQAMMFWDCGGQRGWNRGRIFQNVTWKPPVGLRDFLMDEVEKSEFNIKTSTHIEERPGMLNFSTVGRDCDQNTRVLYFQWDRVKKERIALCDRIEANFDVDALVGGEISIDIVPKGSGKHNALSYMNDGYGVHFFGDNIMNVGNDHSIAVRCSEYTEVKSVDETYKALEKLLA